METASDLEEAVRGAVVSGILPAKEGPQVLEQLSGMLRSVSGRHWFDGTYLLMNEATVIAPGGDSYRPDRMMFSPDGQKAVVVDYKFGSGYMDLLGQMCYREVEGWLWYGEDGVEEVRQSAGK